MKTIAVISQKGGSGKTTIAVHMAVCAMRQGLCTAIVDLDPQISAFDWCLARDENDHLSAVRASALNLNDLLHEAKSGGADFVIIDTAPHSDHDAVVAAQGADFVLIPCRPARFDLKAVVDTVRIIELTKKPFAVTINAAPVRGKLATEAFQLLTQNGLTVTGTVLRQRVAYSHAVIDGRSVHEYEPGGKAATEIDNLFSDLKKILQELKHDTEKKTT